tara:strand:- start:1071 stop:1583 length:513 start_codon:yes stop_codon:yes gene_type:complete
MILLAIGSNLHSKYGDRFQNIDAAILFLESYGIKVNKKSSYYENPSHPNKSDPMFINVVIQVETSLPPEDLASVLIFIEEKLERRRDKKNEPRTCDIDIIDYKNQIINFNYENLNFVVPHERLSSRNFVLLPVKEILPDWIHPKTKETIDTLIKKLSDDDRKSILKVEKN